jgi:hypothetical protein
MWRGLALGTTFCLSRMYTTCFTPGAVPETGALPPVRVCARLLVPPSVSTPGMRGSRWLPDMLFFFVSCIHLFVV